MPIYWTSQGVTTKDTLTIAFQANEVEVEINLAKKKRFKLCLKFVVVCRVLTSIFGVLLMDYGIHKYVENLWFSILSSKGPKNSIDFQIFSIISFWATEKHFYFFFLFGLRLIFILLYCVAKRREKFVCVHRDYRFAFVCICFYPAFYTQRANPSLFVEVNICANQTFLRV